MPCKKLAAEEPGEQVHHLFARQEPPDIEHVPFVAELVEQGLANAVAWDKSGKPTHYRLFAEGQQVVNEIMKRNGERRKQWMSETRRTTSLG